MPIHVPEGVFSHSGGVVTAFTPEMFRPGQIQAARNMRDRIHGAAERRHGSQRIHSDDLGGEFQGVCQWDSPSGSQVVAVSGGNLYHKLMADLTFGSSALSLASRVSFAPHRQSGSPVLYLTDGTSFFKWDGTTASLVGGAPEMDRIAVYKSRMFGVKGKYLNWSAVDNPESWTVANGAGLAAVETYDTDDLSGLIVLGGALLLFKEDNVSRFTGYSTLDIQIDTGTDGISDEIGLIAPETLLRIETVAFFLSDRGPYLATPNSVKEIGFNIEPEFDFEDRALWSRAVAVHNRRRREVWLALPPSGEDENTRVWVYNYRTSTWWGPWDFPFGVSAACRYERTSGQESVLLGGYDGLLRDGDVGLVDDALYDGASGQDVPWSVTYPSLFFGAPQREKLGGPEWRVRADLNENGVLVCDVTNERGQNRVTHVASVGAGVRDYELRPVFSGKELTLTLSGSGSEIVRIDSLKAEAKLGRQTTG